MAKRSRTKAEQEYMDRVSKLGCYINNRDCGGRLELHHKTGAGMGLKSSDYDIIPLCMNHHSAQTPLAFGHSVHKGTRNFEALYGTQDEMIAKTMARVGFRRPSDD